jgi:hypothetical protein
MGEVDVLRAAELVVDALEHAGFSYALGGAIAIAYWGVPRATVDVDVGVACEPMQIPDLLAALQKGGCSVDMERAASAASAAERGDFGCRALGVRVDVFLPVLPLARAALERRVEVPFGTRSAWIVSAEDAVLLKLLFGRTKDVADLERLFAVLMERLDYAYLDGWVERMFPEGDGRRTIYRDLRAKVHGR